MIKLAFKYFFSKPANGKKGILSPVLKKVLVTGLRRLPGFFGNSYFSAVSDMYSRKGVSKGCIALSFDCDLEADNLAVPYLFGILKNSNIKASWAVVGKWLEKHKIYSELVQNGHELINHSFSHPDSEALRPEDRRKFNELTGPEQREEILKMDELCQKLLGYKMKGFRAPHFRITDIAYTVLSELGYAYSSSVPALDSESLGTPYLRGTVLELPLITTPLTPGRIPETYRIFRKPDGLYKKSEKDFYFQFLSLIELVSAANIIAVVYLDPADIQALKNKTFESLLSKIKELGVDTVTLSEAAELCANFR